MKLWELLLTINLTTNTHYEVEFSLYEKDSNYKVNPNNNQEWIEDEEDLYGITPMCLQFSSMMGGYYATQVLDHKPSEIELETIKDNMKAGLMDFINKDTVDKISRLQNQNQAMIMVIKDIDNIFK